MAISESTDDERNNPGGDEDLHAEALRRASDYYAAERENWEKAREAQRFYAGEQWPDADKVAREKENRPVIVINRQKAFVRQVTGDVRKDTPVPKFMPAKDGASQEVADILNGLYRNIDQQSNAKAAYVKAVENACQSSIGWIRVDTEYSSDDGFEQDIRIRRLTDPLAVLCDPSAQEPDKSDAEAMFVLDDMAIEAFKKAYPNASLDPFPSSPSGGMVWKTEKTIKVAEYFYRKRVSKTLYLLANGDVTDKLQAPEQPKQTRKVQTEEIWQCIMSGKEILRDPQRWAGKWIPLVPVVGEEVRLDGRTVRSGMVHDTIGPQQVLNYAVTAQVEQAAKAPKNPFWISATQASGYEDDYATLGSSNAAYALYKSDPNAPGPPKRADPIPPNPGLSELVVQSSQHIKDITGIYDASLGAQSNETSGRAILARQREGDTGTYLYIDNLATALRRVGLILLDLIPKIYDTERVVRVLKEDGIDHEMVTVNQEVQAIDPETGAAITKTLNDLSIGEYDVTVQTGPSFATRRQEAAQSVTELVRSAPNLMAVAGDIIVKNLDFPGAEEIAKRLERTIPPNIKEDGPPTPPPPDPEKMASALDKAASADLKHAQTAKTLLEADQLAAQMSALGVQLQGLTQLVQSLAQGQGGPPQPQQPPMPPPDAMPPGQPIPAAPPMPNGPDMSGGEMVDLEPIDQSQGAPA
jgi:hypothetical protein